eukprot:gene18794-biopygen10190
MTAAQGIGQGVFIDQTTAGRVDDEGARLEQGEFTGTDKVTGVLVQRAVQGQRVDLRQQFVQRHAIGTCRAAWNRTQDHAHTEGFSQARNGAAQLTMAQQAEGFAFQLNDRMVQQAELLGLLPKPRLHVPLIVVQARHKIEQQHDRMLRHRRRAVTLAIAYGNAVGAGGDQVDVVGAGGGHQDQLQLGAGRQGLGIQRDLVADGHLRALQAFDNVFGCGLLVQAQLAEECPQPAEVQVPEVQGRVIKEDGAAIVRHQLYLLRRDSKA